MIFYRIAKHVLYCYQTTKPMYSCNRNRRHQPLTPLHSRTNSNLSPARYHLATRTPLERIVSQSKDNSQIIPAFEPHNIRSIDLYQPNCTLDRHKLSTIMALITPVTLNNASKVSIEDLASNDFPVLKYRIRDLVELSKKILQTSQFCRINFPGKIVRKITALIATNYHSVAYHNYSHAFSLTLLSFQCFQRSFSLKYLFTEQEYFYILIAGLAHDINHPGTNNIYEVKSKSLLAERYNKQSVLENMHISHLWKILRENPDLDFVSASKDKVKARHIITRLILNTDMAFHNKNLDALKSLNQGKKFEPKKNNDHKWMLMEQIFHGCDIGNSCSQFDNYMSWTALLICQFSEQVKLEETNKLEVTKFLIFKDVGDLYKDQLFFVGNLVQPLWKQLGTICPDLGYIAEIMADNLNKVRSKLQCLK